MSECAWNIGFAISLIFAISSSLLIGRKVFRTGVEHFSSRILIFSTIIDASLCSLLFLFQLKQVSFHYFYKFIQKSLRGSTSATYYVAHLLPIRMHICDVVLSRFTWFDITTIEISFFSINHFSKNVYGF